MNDLGAIRPSPPVAGNGGVLTRHQRHSYPAARGVAQLRACCGGSTKADAITEGLHHRMELINHRAYGFRNFTTA